MEIVFKVTQETCVSQLFISQNHPKDIAFYNLVDLNILNQTAKTPLSLLLLFCSFIVYVFFDSMCIPICIYASVNF